MAVSTQCQTPGALFAIHIFTAGDDCHTRIIAQVDLPADLLVDERRAKLLEANIHNALELVLAPFHTS